MIKLAAVVMPLLVFGVPAMAQFSGYASATYGYNTNPLYNYASASDQLRQGFTELNWIVPSGRSATTISYVGGLMIFNALPERNYLEHSLSVGYSSDLSPVPAVEADSDEGQDNNGTDASDSTGKYLGVGLKVGARHDRTAYADFENVGLSLQASYRWIPDGNVVLRLISLSGYRGYTNLAELSNITETALLVIGIPAPGGIEFGGTVSAGVKHYTTSQYDTSQYVTPSGSTGHGSGHGVGLGQGQGSSAGLGQQKAKHILLSPETVGSTQFAGGLYVKKNGDRVKGSVEAVYRLNPGGASRYLAQYANNSILNEDIYNDQFNYEGPQLLAQVSFTLPSGFSASLSGDAGRKRFSAPALALDGTVTAGNRIDVRAGVELDISKFFALSDDIGFDVGCSIGAVRNQSNDDYNDFSARYVSASLGLSF